MSSGIIRIGISGWSYAPWRGTFYPKGLKHSHELHYAASRMRAIEVNGTFYSLQAPEIFAAWADQVAADFVFAIKGPRFITHIRRLKEAEAPLANFIASGLLRLGPHLGPILWQFPPNFRFQPDRLESFLKLLPRTTAEAASIGRHHDSRLRTAPWLEFDHIRPIRHAVEVRHESFCCSEFIEMLRRHEMALVCADSVEWPRLMDVTADFVYCRLHGSEQLYASGYDSAALDQWAARIRAWASGGEPEDVVRIGAKPRRRKRDVFVFFDNDMKVRAPVDATELMRRLQAAPDT